jgi:hypothetical protein
MSNSNIIVAGICAFVSAAFVTQFYYTQYNEYSVYIPIFGLLFYRDNRYRYVNPLTGKKDFKMVKTDIKKLLTAFSISEVAYSLSKISVTISISTNWLNAGIYVCITSSISSIYAID